MMGTYQPQKELFSYQVDLDKRVRADYPLRRVLFGEGLLTSPQG